MIMFRKQTAIVPGIWLHACIVILSGFLLCGVLNAQDLPANGPQGLLGGSFGPGWQAKAPFKQFAEMKVADQHDVATAPGPTAASSDGTIAPGNPRRITLQQAQQQAAAASNPMVHLAQLQVEAARQHRLGVESDYFPKLSSTLTNFHFNKFMGQEITIQRPIAGGAITAGLPLAGKDQTLVAVTAAQPITPLLKLHEVVNIARADERTAMAKAGMPVETASNVEKSYYGLLVAQRQLEVARANAGALRNKQLLATNTVMLPSHQEDDSEVAKAVVIAGSKVRVLTASLNLLLGYPIEQELELATPVTQMEEISLKEAADKAMAANPEVVEAEQTVAKARAASKLSKLDYALELTKAKVAAAVKTSYFEMDRSRQLSALARRISDAIPVERVSYAKEDSELGVSRAKVEIEMLQADLDYRQALAQLKTLMGEQ